MNYTAMRFAVNSPEVVHENFDGEVVIINLDNGNYYSLEGSGAFVWDCIAGGMNAEEIVRAVQDSHTGQTESIDGVISAFVADITKEGLIVQANGTNGGSASDAERLREKAGSFEPPVLKRFTDMQELLLLDPIHEVDEGGWPTKKAEPERRV